MSRPSYTTTIPIHKDDSKQLVNIKKLYNTLIEYRETKTRRILIRVFMCLPSKKEFPDYYDIVKKPISMNKIRKRIDKQLYPDEESCLEDFKSMFSNCKLFNEDKSQIYKDALSLESVLRERREQLHIEHTSTTSAIQSAMANATANDSTTISIAANRDFDSQQSDSTLNDKQSDISASSNSNIPADQIASTSVEKCSLNSRRGKNPHVPKRQLLTGYIIYASEIRKEVIDGNPNQNFGDISRLVGNKWRALPHDIRSKYDQRALNHNRKVRGRAQRNLVTNPHVTKLSKRNLAHLLSSKEDNPSISSPRVYQDISTASQGKIALVDSSIQKNPLRFIEPPKKESLRQSETFRMYTESLRIPNLEPKQPVDLPTHWLGAGHGRHEPTEAAL